MTRPSVAQAVAWQPAELLRLADSWEHTAREMHTRVTAAAAAVPEPWTGAVADEARVRARAFRERGDRMARALVLAAVAARDGAGQVREARDRILALARTATEEGLRVLDDGTVVREADPTTLLILLSGSDSGVATDLLDARATELSTQLIAALDRLGIADDDAAHDIAEATATASDGPAAATVPAGAAVGGGPDWSARIAENRDAIAQAVLDQPADGPNAKQRIAFYESLLAEVDDPTGSGHRVARQILAFDPAAKTLIELNGNLRTADGVAVFVPGMNTAFGDSAEHTAMARRFVAAGRGRIAAITFLGGEFPEDPNVAVALGEASDSRYARDMAPRLVAFSHEVDRAVDYAGRDAAVTFVGHSYGGAILGTAEALGLTADRTLYVAAAGAGFGVEDPADWHNANPDVLRFSMTAPTDPIQLVQGSPVSALGSDPDRMPGVVHLATGRYDDGRPMMGVAAHTDVLDCERSQAWRNVLAVIAGDRTHLVLAG